MTSFLFFLYLDRENCIIKVSTICCPFRFKDDYFGYYFTIRIDSWKESLGSVLIICVNDKGSLDVKLFEVVPGTRGFHGFRESVTDAHGGSQELDLNLGLNSPMPKTVVRFLHRFSSCVRRLESNKDQFSHRASYM